MTIQPTKLDTIWITYRARIRCAERYKLYSNFSHWFFSYYSFLLIVLSLFADDLKDEIKILPEINIALSVALFAASLIIHGFKFEDTSNKHKECYLSLGALLHSSKTDDEKLNEYHKILALCPNHSSYDFEGLLIDKIVFQSQKLWSSSGEYEATWPIIIRHFGTWLIRRALVIAAFVVPLFTIIWPLAND